MRRIVLVLAVVALTAGCGGGDTTSGSGLTSTASSATTNTATQAQASGGLGDATKAANDQAEEVIGEPEPITPDSANAVAGGLPRCPDDDLTINEGTRARAETATVCIINKVRRRRGIRSLKNNNALYQAARAHAQDMVNNQYFSHVSQSGTTVVPRVRAAGYFGRSTDWTVGENIAWGTSTFSTPASIVQSWMNSPGHRRNILTRRYRDAGLAIVVGTPVPSSGDAGTYVHEFGERA